MPVFAFEGVDMAVVLVGDGPGPEGQYRLRPFGKLQDVPAFRLAGEGIDATAEDIGNGVEGIDRRHLVHGLAQIQRIPGLVLGVEDGDPGDFEPFIA